MAWNKEKSADRIKTRWAARDKDLTVTKLTRQMNLDNITLAKSRLVFGAHIYATIYGSGGINSLDTSEDAQATAQLLALWQSEVDRIVQDFGGYRVAFQGARAHLLVYSPIDDDQSIAKTAALIGRAITLMTHEAFNSLVATESALSANVAVDIGKTVATRAGTRGDAELLFLGSSANRPAKLLGDARFAATGRFVDALDDQIECAWTELVSGAFGATISKATIEAEAASMDIGWSVAASTTRLKDDLEKWPTDRFGVSDATAEIQPLALSRSTSKWVDTAVIFVDIEGYSAYIDSAENDDVKRDAMLTLDAIRQEIRAVLKDDYNGVRIQYQGDNMIGIVHLPNGDAGSIATAAAAIAAGIQSSISDTLPIYVADVAGLEVNIGVAFGRCLVACLGSHGRRDALVVGPPASNAERIQMRLGAAETGLHASLYDELPSETQALFDWSDEKKAWIASTMDAAKFARAISSAENVRGRSVSYSPAGLITVKRAEKEKDRVADFRPYAR